MDVDAYLFLDLKENCATDFGFEQKGLGYFLHGARFLKQIPPFCAKSAHFLSREEIVCRTKGCFPPT